jgi:sugar phosphate isomerase/epimerase
MKNGDMSSMQCSRRRFLSAGVCSAAPLILAGTMVRTVAASAGANRPSQTVHVFSKHLQWLDYDGMAQVAAEIGFDGVDLTVRPGGHVLPERVEEDLPRAVDAARRAGIEVRMMTTAINDPSDPLTKSILKTAGALGIRYYRMGYYRYRSDTPVQTTLNEIKPKLRDLAAMNAQFGIAGAYQNHAGNGYVGAPLWDLHLLLKDLDPRWIGSQYDIRHATVEGGTSWPTTLRLLAPHVNTLVAKDFLWTQRARKWQTENCPLGEGMVDWNQYFSVLDRQRIATPFSLHLEYPIGGAEHGNRKLTADKDVVIKAMRRDLSTLKTWLKQRSL